MTLVAGVDGCPDGWLAVSMAEGHPDEAHLAFFPDFDTLLAGLKDASVIAIDMPIGLPDRLIGKGRSCEVAVRRLLGPRQSSVFAIPTRAAVMAGDYREACTVSLETSEPPRKVSKQAFNLFPKIRQIDACWRVGMETRVFECHPEAAFWALNDGQPMALPKKVKSRANPAGLEERAKALAHAGFDPAFLQIGNVDRLPGRAGRDDLLDATVCAWSAARICRGEAISFPDPAEIDSHGRPMAITV